MIDNLREYDVTVSLSLNPLNWRFRVSKYEWFLRAEAGPINVLVIWSCSG